MAGFADIVTEASNNVGGRLLDVNADLTEGTTWKSPVLEITDAAGDPVDLSAATIVCKVIADVDGAEVLSLDTTGGVGTLQVSATSAATAGLATGANKNQARKCLWYCTVTSAGSKVAFWGPSGSNFRIFPA